MNPYIPISSAVMSVRSHPVAILAIDTCSLLDIARIPIRSKKAINARQSIDAINMIKTKSSMTPLELYILIAEQVVKEWHENEENVHKELKRHIETIDQYHSVACSVADGLGTPLPAINISYASIETRVRGMQMFLIDKALILAQDKSINDDAIGRALKDIPPARKGTVKDTVIYLHYLRFFKALRAAGTSSPCVLLSSNTKDYCADDRISPKPEIESELTPLGVAFETDWRCAVRSLGL